jgi:predicted transcriptional regulator
MSNRNPGELIYLVSLYSEKLTQVEIAKELKVSRQAVFQAINNARGRNSEQIRNDYSLETIIVDIVTIENIVNNRPVNIKAKLRNEKLLAKEQKAKHSYSIDRRKLHDNCAICKLNSAVYARYRNRNILLPCEKVASLVSTYKDLYDSDNSRYKREFYSIIDQEVEKFLQ